MTSSRPVLQCKTYACIMESHLMGLTVDFSMGFVCFDAASKVGVRRSSAVNKKRNKRALSQTGQKPVVHPGFSASLNLHGVHFGSVPFKLFGPGCRWFWLLPKSERHTDSSNSARYWNESASAAILFRDVGPDFLKHLCSSRMRYVLPEDCLHKEMFKPESICPPQLCCV